MKKIVLNISDCTYERLMFEAIGEKKSIQDVITQRLFYKPFHKDVEEAFENWMSKELEKIIKE